MKKKLVPLFLAASLLTTVLATFTPAQSEETPALPPINPVELPFNPDTDGPAFVPSDRAQSDKPYDDKRAVVLTDDRWPMLSRTAPWSALGRVEAISDDGRFSSHCTGTLISRDVVLTNSHCIIDKKTNRPFRRPIVFKASMINGVALDEATVVSYDYGWKYGSRTGKDDWALLKLDQPLGDIYSHMGWRSLDFSDPQTRAQLVDKMIFAGYSGDFPTNPLMGRAGETAGVDYACSIIDPDEKLRLDEKLLLHDCDTTGGSSGGPIFALFSDGRFYIVGINSAEAEIVAPNTIRLPDGQRSPVFNIGVPVSQWSARAAAMTRSSQ